MRKERVINISENNSIVGSTLVASTKYLYRGFGKYRNRDAYNQNIERFLIYPELGI